MIKEIQQNELSECVNVIRVSFKTVADELGFTAENAPRFTAFATTEERLNWHFFGEKRPMYAYYDEGKIVGYYSLLLQENNECELNNVCVLPDYRHKGIGEELLKHALQTAKTLGCRKINIGIVEENVVLRKWYENFGFIHTGTQKFEFFPFTCGYMEKPLVNEMKLRLVKASKEYQKQITEMMEEWYETGEKIIPYAIRRLGYHDFEYYCENLEVKDTSLGLVPDSTFFCLDEETNEMVGAVNIRHYLNEALLLNGGHIGDGVRPSMRRRGIATRMIGLALEECKKLGINKVLMVCDKENIGSSKSIINNGGILENEVEVDGVIEQRYWIDISKS